PNTVYYYRVRASDGGSTFSSYSNEISVTTLAATPTNLSASDGLFSNKVAVTWSAASGAAGYQLYRNSTNDPSTATLITSPGSTSFDDQTASANVTYYYWVTSLNSASVSSPKSVVDSGFIDTIAPTIATKSFQNQLAPPALSIAFSEKVSGVDATNITFTT